MVASRKSTWARIRAAATAMVGSEVLVGCLAEFRDLRPQLALRQVRELGRVTLAVDERFNHQPAGLGQDLGSHRGELHPSILEHLLQALDLSDPSVRLSLAIAGQLPQFADRWRRHETGPDHAMGLSLIH